MKYVLVLILAGLMISCGDGKREGTTTIDDDGNIIMNEESRDIMSDLVEEFEDCRANSTKNLLDCKHFTAKAICEFYEIDDFKKGGDYIDYHEMHDMIWGKMATWTFIGKATDQRALEKAQTFANNHQATVAISNRDQYGHVAIILPGHLKTGRSWGLEVPNCASFFLVKSLKPFSDKPLNYAWSSNQDIMLYTKRK